MPDKVLSRIAHKLTEARLSKGLAPKELAGRIGQTESSIYNYEKGVRSPRPDVLLALAQELEVSLDYLFGNGAWGKDVDAFEQRVNHVTRHLPGPWRDGAVEILAVIEKYAVIQQGSVMVEEIERKGEGESARQRGQAS